MAQQRVREVRNALAAELKGLEAGLPDRGQLDADRTQAQTRLAQARGRGERGAGRRSVTPSRRVRREEPRWKAWVARRERTLSLESERRMAEHAVDGARHEFQRLDQGAGGGDARPRGAEALAVELVPLAASRPSWGELELLQQEDAARRADQAQLDELARAGAGWTSASASSGDAAVALAQAEEEARGLERAGWRRNGQWRSSAPRGCGRRSTRQRSDSELPTQYDDVKEQRDKIAQLGPEASAPRAAARSATSTPRCWACSTDSCEAIVEDGKYFRQRLDQLAEPPGGGAWRRSPRVTRLRDESRRASERAGELRARAEERVRAGRELETARARAAAVQRQLATRRTGYDAAHHDAVRASLLKLEPVALEAASLEERARARETLVSEAETAEQTLSEAEQRVRQLADALAAEGYSEKEFRARQGRVRSGDGRAARGGAGAGGGAGRAGAGGKRRARGRAPRGRARGAGAAHRRAQDPAAAPQRARSRALRPARRPERRDAARDQRDRVGLPRRSHRRPLPRAGAERGLRRSPFSTTAFPSR